MILFTGRGTSGSWQCRGVQLGQACGAKVKRNATVKECKKADVIVAVKRLRPETLQAIKASGTRWVLDIVDMYPQPTCTLWSKEAAIGWVRDRITELKPDGLIWPTRRMQKDCAIDLPSIVLHHHYRPSIEINPIRETIKAVGYEGSPIYAQQWSVEVENECHSRGWDFIINPQSLSDVDIVLAFRDADHNGYVQRHWKSNVKLANAHGAGTPFIGPREFGYAETATGQERWIYKMADIGKAFDDLECQENRQHIQNVFIGKRYSVEKAADDLRQFLSGF